MTQLTFDLNDVPAPALFVLKTLQDKGFEAFFVGGSVRDVLLGRIPKDWDVVTNAHPEQVMTAFERSVPVGLKFGTVMVLAPDPVEVTTYRRDLDYHDGRHPQGVVFANTLDVDLERRDFTVNAMAWDPIGGDFIDPADGREDLATGTIRAVGDPEERFREDALRMLRAVRFATELQFEIESDTWRAIEVCARRIDKLSRERVRDELLRILTSDHLEVGLWILREVDLLFRIMPELKPTERLAQAKPGAPNLLSHLIQAAGACSAGPVVRLAALLHDIGKPETRELHDDGRVTFYGHETAGAEIAGTICRRLRMDKASTNLVRSLIHMHMICDDEVTEKAMRRWVQKYGDEWVRDLIALRRADHIASGHRGTNPGADRLHTMLETVVEEASAFSITDLAVDGHEVMEILGLSPGPAVGRVLNELLDRVLDDPTLNERNKLIEIMRQVNKENA